MPFVVLNAVLALVSIVGGIYFYDQLRHTRAQLREVQQYNRQWSENYAKLQLDREALRGEKEVWANQWQRTNDRAKKSERFAQAMHRGFRELLDKHGIRAVVYANSGEVLEVLDLTPLDEGC